MKLEEFVRFVEEPNRVHTEHLMSTSRQMQDLDVCAVLFNALAKSNLLVNSVVFQSGGHYGPLGRNGIVMFKQHEDYEADDEHYVYRCVYQLYTGVTIRGEGNSTASRTASMPATREEAIERLLTQSQGLNPATNITAIEVTQYGKMYEYGNILERQMPAPRAWNRNAYTYNFQTLSDNISTNYISIKTGSRYTLVHENEGIVGEIKLRAIRQPYNGSITPLTEEDITYARRFIKLENDYDGWIPDEINTSEPVISADTFKVYRIADTDIIFKATTVLEKTKDRRTHFNCETNLKHIDKRYTVPPGEYFFSPTSDIRLMSMFDYDMWIRVISDNLTMSRTNSRVGFLVGSAEYTDVKSINIKTKIIDGSADKDVGSTFTRRANSGRLK